MSTRSRFLEAIFRAAQATDARSVQDQSRDIIDAFLAYGSETPDNRDCAQRVEWGSVQDGTSAQRAARGFRLKSGTSLSDILNVAEGCPVPPDVSCKYPSLAQEDWNASMRLVTVLLSALCVCKEPGSRGARDPSRGSLVEKLNSEDLAALVVDALVDAGVVDHVDLEAAIKIASVEIDVRKAMGDY